jgi:hypothetical protein
MAEARGTFEVIGGTEDAFDELDGGITLTHTSGTQTFNGDLSGDGAVHWLDAVPGRQDRPLRRPATHQRVRSVAGRARRPGGRRRSRGRGVPDPVEGDRWLRHRRPRRHQRIRQHACARRYQVRVRAEDAAVRVHHEDRVVLGPRRGASDSALRSHEGRFQAVVVRPNHRHGGLLAIRDRIATHRRPQAPGRSGAKACRMHAATAPEPSVGRQRLGYRGRGEHGSPWPHRASRHSGIRCSRRYARQRSPTRMKTRRTRGASERLDTPAGDARVHTSRQAGPGGVPDAGRGT